ncbi:MAG TPA: ComEC/Rec2 family competence protein [Patescibacteria group bacterium]|nr:ComEC/Rec2 family competence protein [Patescibacteria group bacterium]
MVLVRAVDGAASWWKRAIRSPSWLFFFFCSAFLVGIVVGSFFTKTFDPLSIGIPLAIFFFLAIGGRRPSVRFCALFLLLFGMGFWRCQIALPFPNSWTARGLAEEEAAFSGSVGEEVILRKLSQEVVVTNLHSGERSLAGNLLVRLPPVPVVRFGDRLTFQCRPRVPESIEGFRYDQLLESRGIYAICYSVRRLDIHSFDRWSARRTLFGFKTFLLDRLALVLPEPHAAFAAGLIFGGSSSLPLTLKDDFSQAGLSHVMAASGYNVAIFSQVLLLRLLRSPLGRRRAILLSGSAVFLYVLLAGATPAVVRAGMMALVAMLGLWIRRAPSIRNVLILSAVLMLAANPQLLFHDVGFQLSFAATSGLVLAGSLFGSLMKFLPETAGIRESFATSLAATLFTTPVLLWHFGSLSVVAPLANLVILPWIPLLMLLSGFALAMGILFPIVGVWTALPAWSVSQLVLHLVRWFGSIPFAAMGVPAAHVSALAAAGFAVIFFLWLRKRSSLVRVAV